MRAYKLVRWGQPGQYIDVPQPTPGPLDVLVRVKAVGLCRSDIDMMDSQPGEDPYASAIDAGYILGHETAGFVESWGSSVTDLERGRRWCSITCATAASASIAKPALSSICDHFRRGAIGMTRGCGFDGGLAEFIVVPRTELISVGSADPVLFAPLTDAGVTAYAGCKPFWPLLRPGTSVLVIGVGGVGAYAIQLIKLRTAAKVVAPDTEARVRQFLNGRGVECVLDVVGTDRTLALAAALVRPEGFVSVVGMQGGSVKLGWNRIATNLREVCQLALEGKLQIDIDRFSFDQIPEAYEKLRKGQLYGRAVIVMDNVLQ
ncbi:chaperonin 10-like protein [Ilyonectria robusta]|uniref:chaperonin 10-like protein n=1 Tax=Ilyonectria robusta TaxID=1079257 RepID=UPI001E8CA0D8|nr:chaperonin 10-like protein [Ilyonectria robusta]XP_046094465.1 chaperonin 10-like protein [Ilyonectria robusta]KAH8646003.1 chaperonin 10-like protein [Ilyonectria robusta]KAH8654751.1 chaperonin 10-like protein [Ilyonectria robusta]